MAELLGEPIPRETEASCLECAMCPKGERARTELDVTFNPATKCCTYIPYLPNFIVGRILTDDDPAASQGRTSVEARIRAMTSVTPMGVGRSNADYRTYEESISHQFGRDSEIHCPHFLEKEGGLCGIWRSRPAVCATWFCRYVRGVVGMNFWKSMHHLLTELERALMRWCVLELGVDADALEFLFFSSREEGKQESFYAALADPPVSPEAYRKAWGSWAGREREFYLEAARRVSDSSWARALAIGGSEIELLSRLARSAYRRMRSDELPPRLVPGEYQAVSSTAPWMLRFRGYSPYHLVDLPMNVIDLIPQFDGRATEEVLRAGADAGLVRTMAEFGILTPPL